jgi:hypothetical protein
MLRAQSGPTQTFPLFPRPGYGRGIFLSPARRSYPFAAILGLNWDKNWDEFRYDEYYSFISNIYLLSSPASLSAI